MHGGVHAQRLKKIEIHIYAVSFILGRLCLKTHFTNLQFYGNLFQNLDGEKKKRSFNIIYLERSERGRLFPEALPSITVKHLDKLENATFTVLE